MTSKKLKCYAFVKFPDFKILIKDRSWGSVFSIGPGPCAVLQRNCVSVPGGGRILFCPVKHPNWLWGLPSLLFGS